MFDYSLARMVCQEESLKNERFSKEMRRLYGIRFSLLLLESLSDMRNFPRLRLIHAKENSI